MANPDLAELGKPYRWKPGQSGNPQGRKLSAAINKRLDEAGVPERLVAAILDKIMNDADVAAFKEIITRHEGHVPTKAEITSDNFVFLREKEHDWPEDSP